MSKVGIGEKSAGHRSIYKACDVGIKRSLKTALSLVSTLIKPYIQPVT